MADLGYRGEDDNLLVPIYRPWNQEERDFNIHLNVIRSKIRVPIEYTFEFEFDIRWIFEYFRIFKELFLFIL